MSNFWKIVGLSVAFWVIFIALIVAIGYFFSTYPLFFGGGMLLLVIFWAGYIISTETGVL